MNIDKIFSPININRMTLDNRIMMSAMETNFGTESGEVTQQMIDYYARRARAKPGLIMVEPACIDMLGRLMNLQLCIYNDTFISGLTRLAEAIKACGTKCAIQVFHGGRGSPKRVTGKIPVAPSGIRMWNEPPPHELSESEIDNIVEEFAFAAERARKCGFDAVEFHFAHGFLGSQFLSPLTNKRRDKYGGDLENRARFCVEVVAATRRRLGNDYPLLVRLGVEEHIRGGLRLQEGAAVAHLLELAGSDAIDVSTGYRASGEEGYLNCTVPRVVAPMHVARGVFLHLAEAVKKQVTIPVITVGRIIDLDQAALILADKQADIVAMGRAFLADPDFIAKFVRGKNQDIRKCIACNECQTRLSKGEQIRCAVNAELGREAVWSMAPAKSRKKVLVIGGGPAGMEAARLAAVRGHRVVLAEKSDKLGGNLLAAARPSFKREIESLSAFLAASVRQSGVDVRLNAVVDRSFVEAMNPDVMILANGGKPVKPKITGIDKPIVTDAISVFLGKAKAGPKVLVIGGGQVGCEIACFLAQEGKNVTIVEIRRTDWSPTEGLAVDEEPSMRRWLLFELWPTLDITVLGQSAVKEITDEGAVVVKSGGIERLIKCDTVICAMGMTPSSELKDGITVPEVYTIGDSRRVHTIMEAIHDGAKVGLEI